MKLEIASISKNKSTFWLKIKKNKCKHVKLRNTKIKIQSFLTRLWKPFWNKDSGKICYLWSISTLACFSSFLLYPHLIDFTTLLEVFNTLFFKKKIQGSTLIEKEGILQSNNINIIILVKTVGRSFRPNLITKLRLVFKSNWKLLNDYCWVSESPSSWIAQVWLWSRKTTDRKHFSSHHPN